MQEIRGEFPHTAVATPCSETDAYPAITEELQLPISDVPDVAIVRLHPGVDEPISDALDMAIVRLHPGVDEFDEH